jgi:hypothetical protein
VNKQKSAYAILKENQKTAKLRQQVRLDGGVIVDGDTVTTFQC